MVSVLGASITFSLELPHQKIYLFTKTCWYIEGSHRINWHSLKNRIDHCMPTSL